MNSAPLGIDRRYARIVLLVVPLIALVYLSISTVHAAPADEGQAIFQQKCQSCHTVGKGRTVGPDLQGVTSKRDRSWLVKFITAPDQVIAQGDPTAKQLVQEFGMPMPNLGVSEKDAEALLAYLEAQSGAGKAPEPQGGAVSRPAAETVAATGDANIGRALFTGEVGFANGGAACISCHNANSVGGFGGGSLARDLTISYGTLGPASMKAIITAAPFPVMKAAFANSPLTDAEVENLIAFLRQESTGQTLAPAPNTLAFPLLALVIFFVVLGLIQFAWRRRLQGVRQPLLKGAHK